MDIATTRPIRQSKADSVKLKKYIYSSPLAKLKQAVWEEVMVKKEKLRLSSGQRPNIIV